jgi:hypothetical protein
VKRHTPDQGDVNTALAGRVDGIERRLGVVDDLRADVTALGRGVADLTAQVRALAATVTSTSIRTAGARPTAHGDGGDPAGSDGGPDGSSDGGNGGQRDWLTVADPALAAGWLEDIAAWVDDVLHPLGLAPAATCWPLHPAVVVELLAATAERAAAYTGGSATPVSEWLARWQPGATARLGADLRACVEDRGHRTAGRTYAVPRLDPTAVARWWVDGRGLDPDAVTAFTLTPLT